MIGDVLYLRGYLLQPVRHSHLSVHRRRGGEMLLRLLVLVGAPVESGQAEVAVGDERAHAELIGQIESFAIQALRLVEIGRRAAGGDVGENPQDPCLPAAGTDATAGVKSVPGGRSGVAGAAAREIHLGEQLLRPNYDRRPSGSLRLVRRLLEEGQPFLDPADQGLRVAQVGAYIGEKERHGPGPRAAQTALQNRDGPAGAPLPTRRYAGSQ